MHTHDDALEVSKATVLFSVGRTPTNAVKSIDSFIWEQSRIVPKLTSPCTHSIWDLKIESTYRGGSIDHAVSGGPHSLLARTMETHPSPAPGHHKEISESAESRERVLFSVDSGP